jgi:hypothetical protein
MSEPRASRAVHLIAYFPSSSIPMEACRSTPIPQSLVRGYRISGFRRFLRFRDL